MIIAMPGVCERCGVAADVNEPNANADLFLLQEADGLISGKIICKNAALCQERQAAKA